MRFHGSTVPRPGGRELWSSRTRRTLVAAVVLAIGIGALVGAGTLDQGPRDVVLVVRDMAFYLDGEGLENPTLHFKAGEEIRLHLQNEEAGVTHNFAVREWHLATRRLQGRDRDTLTFRVPERSGRYDYLCNPHASMMRGIIEVE
jgi:plastocyanin